MNFERGEEMHSKSYLHLFLYSICKNLYFEILMNVFLHFSWTMFTSNVRTATFSRAPRTSLTMRSVTTGNLSISTIHRRLAFVSFHFRGSIEMFQIFLFSSENMLTYDHVKILKLRSKRKKAF